MEDWSYNYNHSFLQCSEMNDQRHCLTPGENPRDIQSLSGPFGEEKNLRLSANADSSAVKLTA